ncbi:MAG: hypothetical protein K6F27_05045 [Ruminococcus sp.]|nr:hypothetical protein [Ruminococcus sp.]
MNKTGKKLKGSYTVEALIVIPVILMITITVCGVFRYIEKVNRVITACNASTVEFNNYITVLNAAGLENVLKNAPQGERAACDENIEDICSLADLSGINSTVPEEYTRGGTSLIVTNGLDRDSVQVKARLVQIHELMKDFTKADVNALITRVYKAAYDHSAAYLVSSDIAVDISTAKSGSYYTVSVSARIPLVFGITIEKSITAGMMEAISDFSS